MNLRNLLNRIILSVCFSSLSSHENLFHKNKMEDSNRPHKEANWFSNYLSSWPTNADNRQVDKFLRFFLTLSAKAVSISFFWLLKWCSCRGIFWTHWRSAGRFFDPHYDRHMERVIMCVCVCVCVSSSSTCFHHWRSRVTIGILLMKSCLNNKL